MVVHLEVFEQRFLGIDRERVDDAAVGCDRHAAFGVGQWRAVEESRETLASFAFDEQGSLAARCQGQRERGSDGGFAGAALAGDDVQADAVPVAIAPAVASLRVHRRAYSLGSPLMTKWEYATVPLLVHATKQILDNWGGDGWELVSHRARAEFRAAGGVYEAAGRMSTPT